MPLLHQTYGKGRVRVMRVHRGNGRDGERNEVRELTVQAMLEGGFAAAYTHADNRAVVATDTIKNIAYIVARENLQAPAEGYAAALAQRFLGRYPQVERATVQTWETRWVRATVDGAPHPHSFVLDANGRPTATATLSRTGPAAITSGLAGYTFMKSTQSGWAGFVSDEYTTLPDTHDRLAATAMDASWTWRAVPADYGDANARILGAMLREFATTFSHGIQDSLYRMGEAALAAVPEAEAITMACPNKHYLPVSLDRFGLQADNTVFVPTDEPHGQIECTVGRG